MLDSALPVKQALSSKFLQVGILLNKGAGGLAQLPGIFGPGSRGLNDSTATRRKSSSIRCVREAGRARVGAALMSMAYGPALWFRALGASIRCFADRTDLRTIA